MVLMAGHVPCLLALQLSHMVFSWCCVALTLCLAWAARCLLEGSLMDEWISMIVHLAVLPILGVSLGIKQLGSWQVRAALALPLACQCAELLCCTWHPDSQPRSWRWTGLSCCVVPGTARGVVQSVADSGGGLLLSRPHPHPLMSPCACRLGCR